MGVAFVETERALPRSVCDVGVMEAAVPGAGSCGVTKGGVAVARYLRCERRERRWLLRADRDRLLPGGISG